MKNLLSKIRKHPIISLVITVSSSLMLSLIANGISHFVDFDDVRDTLNELLNSMLRLANYELRTWWVLLGLSVFLVFFYIYQKYFNKKKMKSSDLTVDKTQESREIADLKNKLLEITEELSLLKTPPDISFYECEFEIEYRCFNLLNRDVAPFLYKVKHRLPELFMIIAIDMVDLTKAEPNIKNTIEIELPKRYGDEFHRYSLADTQVVKRILIQLQALKLVVSSNESNNEVSYWTLTEYGKKVRNDFVLQRSATTRVEANDIVANEPSLNYAVLAKFIMTNEKIKEFDAIRCRRPNTSMHSYCEDITHSYLKRLHWIGISTLEDLTAKIDEHYDFAVYFVEKLDSLKTDKRGSSTQVFPGNLLHYLCYSIVFQEQSVDKIIELLEVGGYKTNLQHNVMYANYLQIYNDYHSLFADDKKEVIANETKI